MNGPLKLGGLVALALLGATAVGAAVLLSRDPELLKRLVKQGALSYNKAAALLAEWREELGDILAEALQQAEDELREVGEEAEAATPPDPVETESQGA
jgi:hypothetical protein